ncbi:unnamed protein product, partial [Rotaria sp. Silwood2]
TTTLEASKPFLLQAPVSVRLINKANGVTKRSRPAIAAFLIIFLVLVVILPIVLIIIALASSTINFVSSIANFTTVQHTISLIVPSINDDSTKSGLNMNNNNNN